MEDVALVVAMTLYGGSNFQKWKIKSKNKYYNYYQKDTIVEIINFLIKEKKLILLDIMKISNICQNSRILNTPILEPTKL